MLESIPIPEPISDLTPEPILELTPEPTPDLTPEPIPASAPKSMQRPESALESELSWESKFAPLTES